MNKILLNKNGRNHIKIFPIKDIIEIPESEAERILSCKRIFESFASDESAIRHYYYRNVKSGCQVTVYESDNKIYLTNCIRDPEHNYVTTVYISDNLSDMIAIAKFLVKNNRELTESYKNQIMEGYEEWLKLQKPDSQTK